MVSHPSDISVTLNHYYVTNIKLNVIENNNNNYYYYLLKQQPKAIK
jgi:hypothetical protein